MLPERRCRLRSGSALTHDRAVARSLRPRLAPRRLARRPARARADLGRARRCYAAPQIADRLEAARARRSRPARPRPPASPGCGWRRAAATLAAEGEAPDVGERETVLARLAALDGPRRIVSEVGLVETAAPFLWAAIRTGSDRIALEGSRPAEIGTAGPGGADHRRAGARHLPRRHRPGGAGRAAGFRRARRRSWRRGSPGSPRAAGRRSATRCSACPARPWTCRPTRRCGRPWRTRRRVSASGGSRSCRPRWRSSGSSWRSRPGGSCSTGSRPPRRTARRPCGPPPRRAAGGTVRRPSAQAARGLDPAIDPKSLIGFAFRLAELIQSGRVSFADGAISVTGDAIDGQAIPDAEALMRDARPAGIKAGPVSLTARPLSPYRVVIRRTAERSRSPATCPIRPHGSGCSMPCGRACSASRSSTVRASPRARRRISARLWPPPPPWWQASPPARSPSRTAP